MPPRSTGCANCRKRKIKCDESRPSCKKCLIHNTPCPGYRGLAPDGLEWRDETAAVVRRVERRYKPKQHPNSDNSSNISDFGSSESSSPEDVIDKPIPTEILSATINRAQIFDICMRFYQPETSSLSSSSSSMATISTAHISDLSIIQRLLNSNSKPVLLAAVDALSLVQLGVSFKDKVLWVEARKRYGVALQGLVLALGRKDVLGDNDVLAAMKLLEYCELFDPIAQQGSWLSHVDGTETFLKRRGPIPLKTELDSMLFFHARHSSVIKAIPQRKALCFAQPEWLALSKDTSLNDPSSKLFDILVHIPGLFQTADKILASSPNTTSFNSSTLSTLTFSLIASLNTLQSWLQDYQLSFPTFPFQAIPTSHFETFSQLVPSETFPYTFSFDNFWTAYLHSVAWIYMASVQKTLLGLHGVYPDILLRHCSGAETKDIDLPFLLDLDIGIPCHHNDTITDTETDTDTNTNPTNPPNTPWTRESLETKLLQHTTYLCQILPYLVEPSSSSIGKFAMFMPLIFCFEVFRERQMKEEAKWCIDVTKAVFKDGISPPWLFIMKGKMEVI